MFATTNHTEVKMNPQHLAKKSLCECSDPGCPHHKGKDICTRRGYDILFRSDMEDETGTVFCADCADDAFTSGLFTTKEDI